VVFYAKRSKSALFSSLKNFFSRSPKNFMSKKKKNVQKVLSGLVKYISVD
jgi:hypothetical protein